MEKRIIIGTDVSKLTLDHAIKTKDVHLKINNNKAGFVKWLKWALKYGDRQNLWIVMEHTGYYSYQFELFLQESKISYSKIPALEIKRSIGLVRGKNDKVDALMISKYGVLRMDELKDQKGLSINVIELKDLFTLRDKLSRDIRGYKSRIREQIETGKYGKDSIQYKIQKRSVDRLTKDIKEIELEMKKILEKDESLQTNYELLVSIKGIGFVVAIYMIAYTDNFTRFENSRKFSCYAGLAPFEHLSGTSLRGKSRVSHYANKTAKSLLNMAAACAIQHCEELKTYYLRKVEEGKNKMSVLNIIRNKLVGRMFAIIKRQTPYEENYLAAA